MPSIGMVKRSGMTAPRLFDGIGRPRRSERVGTKSI